MTSTPHSSQPRTQLHAMLHSRRPCPSAHPYEITQAAGR